jgi:hypothetical protein
MIEFILFVAILLIIGAVIDDPLSHTHWTDEMDEYHERD